MAASNSPWCSSNSQAQYADANNSLECSGPSSEAGTSNKVIEAGVFNRSLGVSGGWSKVRDESFIYAGQPLASADRGSPADDDELLYSGHTAAGILASLEEVSRDKEGGVKDKTVKSRADRKLQELFAQPKTGLAVNLGSDDELMNLANSVGVCIELRHLNGCLLTQYVAATAA